MPGETFEEIARKVREAMEVEDFDMLLWERERVEQRDGMDQLFDENGPLDGVSAAWHGYYARWIMIHRPKWLPQSAEGVEPAVIYWTLYLKLRVNLPDQEVHPPGMAPWEWTGGRPNWLD